MKCQHCYTEVLNTGHKDGSIENWIPVDKNPQHFTMADLYCTPVEMVHKPMPTVILKSI